MECNVSFPGRIQILENIMDSLFGIRAWDDWATVVRQTFFVLEAQRCGWTEALLMSVIKINLLLKWIWKNKHQQSQGIASLLLFIAVVYIDLIQLCVTHPSAQKGLGKALEYVLLRSVTFCQCFSCTISALIWGLCCIKRELIQLPLLICALQRRFFWFSISVAIHQFFPFTSVCFGHTLLTPWSLSDVSSEDGFCCFSLV